MDSSILTFETSENVFSFLFYHLFPLKYEFAYAVGNKIKTENVYQS